MNFILLTDYYHPIIKSGSIVIGDLATELLRQGHTVTIMTFVSDQKNQCDDFKDDRLRILRIKISGRKYGMVGRLYAENCYSSKVIKILKEKGFVVIVITNQSAINRGLVTIETLNEIHNHLQKILKELVYHVKKLVI